MTDELLRTLEGKLRARECQLREKLRALLDRFGDPPGAAARGGVADRGDAAVEGNEARITGPLLQAQRELEEVEAALARVASPDFARCGACAQAIELRRLRARPESRLCLGCERSLDLPQPS